MAITKVTTPELIDLPNNQLVTGVSTTYNITVISSGGNKYAVNGTQQANITLIPGTTYTINQDDSTNNAHPLILSTSTVAAGVYSTGVTYSLNGAGVSYASYISGFATATQRRLTITLSSPPTLNYICYYHTGMGGSIITTPGLANTDGVVLPKGLTTDRPTGLGASDDGTFRYNTTTKKVEYYDGSSWFTLNSSTIVPQLGTTGVCNYPITATALYQLNSDGGVTNNVPDTCGSYNGTATSITYSAGNFGNAANFNGTSSRITSSPISGLSSTSISCWLKSSNSSSSERRGVVELNADTSSNGYAGTLSILYRYSDGSILVRNGNASSSETDLLTHTDTTLRNGNWNNLVVTRNESTGVTTLYINGSQVDQETVASTSTVGGGTIIGDRYTGSAGNYNWDGEIDQVRIFPTTLTATQVGYLYTETAP